MTTRLQDILDTARMALSLFPTSRNPAESFLEHVTNDPFGATPIAGRDGFEVVARESKQTAGFGISGVREWETMMVVRLGHAPYDTDTARDNLQVEDMERVVDLIETNTTYPVGTMLVLHEATDVNKEDPSWWMTELTFKVVWVGDLRTA